MKWTSQEVSKLPPPGSSSLVGFEGQGITAGGKKKKEFELVI